MKNEKKKKSPKKLSLNKETLRNLTPKDLSRVFGGMKPDSVPICESEENGAKTCEPIG